MNPLLAGAFLGALILPVPPPVRLPGSAPVPPALRPVGTDLAAVEPPGSALSRPGAVWPLDPRPEVIAGFLAPATDFGPGHRGVDLLSSVGAHVRAALAGTVAFAGTVAGRGVVVLDHGSFQTTYEPVEASVHPGETVGTGQVIGTLQSALSHCAPRICLHWGLVQDSAYADPLTLLGRARVRLLPLGDQARGWAR